MQKQLIQIASKDLLVVHWAESMEAAFYLMQSNQIRHLPVVNDDDCLVGILSDRDTRLAMQIDQADFSSGKTPRPEFDPQATVRDYMSWPLDTIDEGSSVADAARTMLERRISSLIVMRGSSVVGIVTSDDLLATIVESPESKKMSLKDKVATAFYDSPIGSIAQTLANAGV